LAVAAAIFVGGFVGNIVSTKRRPPMKPSIYGTVQRRIEMEEEKANT
jgi:hypothetical protein